MDKRLLAELKTKYGALYMLNVEDIDVYFRSLNAWELQSFLEIREDTLKSKIEIENALCLFAVLYPTTPLSFQAPGSSTLLATEIWSKSVPTDQTIELMVDKHRAWAEDAIKENYNIMIAIALAKLLPSVDLISLLNLPTSKLLKVACLIENATDTLFLKGESKSETTSGSVNLSPGADHDELSAALSTALSAQKQNNKNK
tara:strand:+ start:451 stop:1053 length:603 start_codon:yes stop_codon:yes gene_type:complete